MKLVTLPPSYQFLSADNFNPHEREARDQGTAVQRNIVAILIHTSVKLVTRPIATLRSAQPILIHTSVKLVTVQVP